MNGVFDKSDYRYQLHKDIFGIPQIFARDVRCCWQRIHNGYCEKDVWSIDSWFLKTVPDMLQTLKDTHKGSPSCLGKNHVNEKGVLCNDSCHTEWDKLLDKMIFLFHEADKDKCSRKNPLEKEANQICTAFEAKYGFLGEKLMTKNEKKLPYRKFYSPSDLPEYAEKMERYFKEERKLETYRSKCKDEAFTLFSK